MSNFAFQSDFYRTGDDYLRGSPHLQHAELRARLAGTLRQAVKDLVARDLPLRVLEVGAGDGGFTEVALALGCRVTAVDMSKPALNLLVDNWGTNKSLNTLWDEEGTLSQAGDGYSLLLAVSVLHHIPDYLAFLEEVLPRLSPGAAVLTLQDPIWYDRVPWRMRVANRVGYAMWRMGQGNLARAAATSWRRLRGVYDTSNEADMVEYHVVRDGVDEYAIRDLLEPHFEDVVVLTYWSNQSGLAQRIGHRRRWTDTFGVYAVGKR